MVFTTIFTFVTTTLGLSTACGVTFGTIGAVLVYGGIAVSIFQSKQSQKSNVSPSYSGALQTQTNQDLPVPLLYGTVKLAGNRIWQDDNATSSVKRIVAFAEGEITDFTEIKLNDIPVNEIVGCTVRKYFGTHEQTVDSIVDSGIAAAISVNEDFASTVSVLESQYSGEELNNAKRAAFVGGLKNIAYLAISVPPGDKISANYNLTAVVKGKKIRVYSSASEYTVQYSENPAWVMFDFLTSYNGLGLAVTDYGTINDNIISEIFDMESFLESAAFADERVNGKPRFTFNMIFDSQTSARTLIDEIHRSCRGGLFSKNGKLQFKIDKAESVSRIFTAQDIISGSETFQTLSSEEHYDILKCVYISPEHEWQKVEAFAEVPEYRESIPTEHSINIYSVTNFEQAGRLAWYYVNSKILQPYFGSFQTDYRAYDLEVGDVIAIDSLLTGVNSYKVKVTSVIDEGSGTFTVNWRTYDASLYSDAIGCIEPTVMVTGLADSAAYPDDIANFNVMQNQNLFNFVWDYNESAVDTYEIRQGENFETGEIIAEKLMQNSYSCTIKSKGIHKFWIKAFNGYNYSQNATYDPINISDIPNVNEVVTFDILNENLTGTFTDTSAHHGSLKLNTDGVLWQTTGGKWGDDDYYQKGGKWGSDVYSFGTYVSPVFDIGADIESIVSFSYLVDTAAENQDISFEMQYSSDGVNFTEFKLLNTGTYKFRYCRFRVTMKAYYKYPFKLSKFLVSADVPDKLETRELEITNAVTGADTEYDFTSVPSIVATVNDTINAYAVVSAKTAYGATIKLYDNNGNLTTGKVSLYLKGY